MSRRRTNDYPKFMYDGGRGDFIIRNPTTGQRRRFADETEARTAALELARLLLTNQQLDALNAGQPTIRYLIKQWIAEELPHQPWDDGTRSNELSRLGRIDRELGERSIGRTQGKDLRDWLHGVSPRGDLFNKYRYLLVLLWKLAVIQKWAKDNEAEKVPTRSTSKKLAVNRKSRQQLTLQDFKAIHAKAPAWLQLAMELSLKTLQSRKEIVDMKFTDFRDGRLFVRRDKVTGVSDMGFIKIAVDGELEDLRRRALTLGQQSPTVEAPICVRAFDLYEAGVGRIEIAQRLGSTPKKISQLICHERKRRQTLMAIASPYVVHYRPERRTRESLEAKPHWTYVTPSHLTETFAEARNAAGIKVDPKRTPPTFHEIRGLAARLMLERLTTEGQPSVQAREKVSALMTHSQPATTEIYLEKGEAGLTDADYIPVATVLSLRDYLKT